MGKQDYDHLAEAYRRHRETHPDVVSTVISVGRLTAESRVLEIGCGTGNYIHEIAEGTGAACTGADPSWEMLRYAAANVGLPKNRRANRPEVTFVRGAAEQLPLPDGQYDLVYSVDVIHHIGDRDAAARETLRVLKPGGMAMIVTESECDLHKRTPHVNYFPEIVGVELQRYPSIETIQQELANGGLVTGDVIEVARPIEVTDIAPFRDKAYSSLHLIDDAAFRAGLDRIERDLTRGPVSGERRYTIVTAHKPA